MNTQLNYTRVQQRAIEFREAARPERDGHGVVASADPARATPARLRHLKLHRLVIRVIGAVWGI